MNCVKGYAVLLSIAAALLLILPLPALPRTRTPVNPPVSTPESTPTQEGKSDIPTASTVFRVLTGDTVTALSCREFLIRTLAFEMSPTYHPEALKAQTVAAYTYYGRRHLAQQTNPDATLHGADFKSPGDKFPQEYDTDKLRERWGEQFDTYYATLCAAVDEVLGKHMTYNGEWIDACFFAMSNGHTESAKNVWGSQVPYLQAVASPGDKLTANYETNTTLTTEQVKAALIAADATITLPKDPTTWFGEATLSDSGTVLYMPVGNKIMTGVALRSAFGLRSATFRVSCTQDGFSFTVQGYGHGVGMSQCGANHMAKQGYTWQEILQYYYTGVTIE